MDVLCPSCGKKVSVPEGTKGHLTCLSCFSPIPVKRPGSTAEERPGSPGSSPDEATRDLETRELRGRNERPRGRSLPEVLAAGPIEAVVENARRDPENNLGRFVILAEVGRGGMGVVYRAWDDRLGRVVALKILQKNVASDQTIKRFHREAQAVARLRHEGIVGIHDVGELEGLHYLAMDFVEGETLAAKLPQGRGLEQPGAEGSSALTLRKAAGILAFVARALHHAHGQGVVHRDMKPQNIMIDPSGRPVIMDFGLARVAMTTELTETGTTLGTPAFMPPEQAGPKGKADARSDIYSLGATLYQVLAGRPPFEGENVYSVIAAIMNEKPVPPSTINRAAAGELEAICLRCLEKDPEKRFQTALDLASALDRYVSSSPSEAPPAAKGPSPSAVSRATEAASVGIRAGAVAVALGSAVILGALLAFHGPGDANEGDRARAGNEAKPSGGSPAARSSAPVASTEPPAPMASSAQPSPATSDAASVSAATPSADAGAATPRRATYKGPHGAVLYFSFDRDSIHEKDGKTWVADASGNGNDGLVIGAKCVPGKVGEAFSFNEGLAAREGTDHVEVAASKTLDAKDELTIAAWIKPGPHVREWQHFMTIASKGPTNSLYPGHWDTGGDGLANYAFRLSDRTASFYYRGVVSAKWNWFGSSPRAFDDLEWHHVAIVQRFGDPAAIRVYIDDVERTKTSGRWVEGHGDESPVQNGGKLFVGAAFLPDERVTEPFQGLIDELGIWTRALSGEEVDALYKARTGGK